MQDEAADQIRVDVARGVDLAAGRLLDLLQDAFRLVLRKLVGGGELDLEPALLGCQQAIELADDVVDLADPSLLGGQPQEVPDERVGIAQQLLDDSGLRGGVELGVA